MLRSVIMAAGLLGAFVNGAALAADADVYRIRIFQADDAARRAATMLCSSSQRTLSTGRLEIADGGHALEVTAIASCAGNLYVMFATDGQFLFIGSQPYAHILFGPSHIARKRIALSTPPATAHQDSPDGAVHRLVERLPGDVIGELIVEVEPAAGDPR